RVAPLPARHPAPDRQRAVRDRAAAVDLDVHQVRHGVAAGRRGRGEPLHPDAAGLRLLAELHLPPGRDGGLAGGDHVRDAAGGDRDLLPPVPHRGGLRVSGGGGRASALYGAGMVLLLGAAFPLFWMLSTALKPSGEIFATPRFVPLHPTLENFQRLFADTAFLVFFRNSVLVAGLILLTYMFAPIMIIIPFYILVKQLGIVNTRLALVLSYTTFCLPFCLWVLRAFF